MKLIIYTFVVFLIPTLMYGQGSLIFEGRVTDARTHKPLQETNVYIGCQHEGTVTDMHGKYRIEVPSCCMTQCLIVSYMGYEKFMIPVHNIPTSELNIELYPGVITLAELVITPDQYWIIFEPEFESFSRMNLSAYLADEIDKKVSIIPKSKLKSNKLISMR